MEIYDPLNEYINVFQHRFKEVAADTFAALASEAHVDVKANRQTCNRLYAQQRSLATTQERLLLYNCLTGILWLTVGGGIFYLYMKHSELETSIIILVALIVVLSLIVLLVAMYPYLKKLKNQRNTQQATIEQLQNKAWEQMAPLNRLYDWDILTRMMTQTVPKLEFDPFFTTQRLKDLQMTYGWDDTFNQERSVIYSHSGLINGNPFIICRTRKMEMSSKTYYGSKTIYWTTSERGSDGKYHSIRHSEVLTASVTAPYPEYLEKTRLIYGNTAAPNLIFYRMQNGLADKEDTLSFKWNKHILRKKVRKLSNMDFAMMTNEEFEVAFNTSNRNNNQQFALLFTPLAQESMLSLLKDHQAGYGDDFDFEKNKMINVIISNHMQDLDLDMNPEQYHNFDYDKAQQDFYQINTRYFRAIYFCFAPLLCVPLYQQLRPRQAIYGIDMQRYSAFWEHEAIANFWGQEHFQHPDCVTNCILKTETRMRDKENAVLKVYAYGYSATQRLTYVERWGGDCRLHSIPVYWNEYKPVTGTGEIDIVEDNESVTDDTMTQRQRLEHISDVLYRTNFDVYRRHIASKV